MLTSSFDENLWNPKTGVLNVPRMVGTGCFVLHGEYDLNQEWFDFMQGVVIFHKVKSPNPASKPKKQKNTNKSQYAVCPPECRAFFKHEIGIHQYCLPFYEARRVSNKELQLLIENDFPGWERTENGGFIFSRFITIQQIKRKSFENGARKTVIHVSPFLVISPDSNPQ